MKVIQSWQPIATHCQKSKNTDSGITMELNQCFKGVYLKNLVQIPLLYASTNWCDCKYTWHHLLATIGLYETNVWQVEDTKPSDPSTCRRITQTDIDGNLTWDTVQTIVQSESTCECLVVDEHDHAVDPPYLLARIEYTKSPPNICA